MQKVILSLAIAAIAALSACGGGGSSSTSPAGLNPMPNTPATSPPGTSSDPTLPQQETVGGQTIWETKGGLPLYTFTGDAKGVSNCTASCAALWPPLMSGAASVATGAFTIVNRTNPNGSQWAYNGAPLYTFISDKPGSPPTGNGVQGFSIAVVSGQSGGPSSPPGCTGPYC